MSEKAYILLGSNMGDREHILDKACCMIAISCGDIIMKSAIYESEPWGFTSEQWFLNQVILVDVACSAHELMECLLSIESLLGRERTSKNGYSSRPIDLDVLYFWDAIINDDFITVPHPRLHLRRFTLLPLCDIAPDFLNPVFNKSNSQLLAECDDKYIVKQYKSIK